MDYRLKFKKGYQKKLFLDFKKNLNLSERDLSNKFKVSRRTIRSWISEERTLPSNIFSLMLKENKKLNKYNKFISMTLNSNWGKIYGGKQRYKNLKKEGKFLKHHKIMMDNLRKKSISQQIPLPLNSNYFKYIKKQKIPVIPLLQTMLFTDGYLNEKANIISYTSKSICLINIFNDFLNELSDKKPRIRLRKNGVYEIYLYDKKLSKRLLKLSPTYKTKLGNFPSLNYLFKQENKTIIECLRLAMSTDGCIILGQESKNPFKIRSRLVFCCFNVPLLKEWRDLFSKIGFNTYLIKKGKDYISLGTTKKDMIKHFYSLGGFAGDVEISGKSTRFKGYLKNDLLKIALNIQDFKSWDKVIEELDLLSWARNLKREAQLGRATDS